jgi:hypothetical protein
MKTLRVVLGALAGLIAMTGYASAQTTIYNNPGDFEAAAADVVGYSFPYADGLNFVSPSYTQDGVTFSSVNLFEGQDLGYIGTPYLDSFTEFLTISTTTSALGLYLGGYDGAETVDYTVDGVSGSVALGANRQQSFIGFGDVSGPVSVTFDSPAELDVTTFATGDVSAAPEPSTWALLIAGIAVVGGAIRMNRGRDRTLIVA